MSELCRLSTWQPCGYGATRLLSGCLGGHSSVIRSQMGDKRVLRRNRLLKVSEWSSKLLLWWLTSCRT